MKTRRVSTFCSSTHALADARQKNIDRDTFVLVALMFEVQDSALEPEGIGFRIWIPSIPEEPPNVEPRSLLSGESE